VRVVLGLISLIFFVVLFLALFLVLKVAAVLTNPYVAAIALVVAGRVFVAAIQAVRHVVGR